MDYSPLILESLFNEVAKKADVTLEHSDSDFLAEEINEYDINSSIKFNGKYLYEAQRKIKLAAKDLEESIEFNPSYINQLAKYLGFRDYHEFKKKNEIKFHENKSEEKAKTLKSENQHSTYIGKNINKIEGDINNGTINNY